MECTTDDSGGSFTCKALFVGEASFGAEKTEILTERMDEYRQAQKARTTFSSQCNEVLQTINDLLAVCDAHVSSLVTSHTVQCEELYTD